jgi:hypothetical protein
MDVLILGSLQTQKLWKVNAVRQHTRDSSMTFHGDGDEMSGKPLPHNRHKAMGSISNIFSLSADDTDP